MAPNKFEKHIKKQLQEREIQPSEMAWTSLSEKLDTITPVRKRKKHLWYGAAAFFIGAFIVSVLYFTTNNFSAATNLQIVDSPKKIEIPKEGSVANLPNDRENFVTVDSANKLGAEEEVVLNSIKDKNKKIEVTVANKIKNEYSLELKIEFHKESIYKVDEVLNAKIIEVLAEVRSLETENVDLTDTEVDSLLRKAQIEILTNRMIRTDNKIDPMALLTDVEDQLDQSFRDKLFERLKTGFVKVKTAVADNDN